MAQVIVGIFRTYRDGHDALRALQAQGWGRDVGHLYLAGSQPKGIDDDPAANAAHSCGSDNAEYAAHGEHLGARMTGHDDRPPAVPLPATDAQSEAGRLESGGRTLLVINEADASKLAIAHEVLNEHGALAVKDPGGRWHFSPYRSSGR